MASIRWENITKDFGRVVAVKELNLDCADGEFLALLGPSGCGKTTTLRMTAGLETPTSGTIYFDGKPINHLAPRERNIAMVFENYALYPHRSVYRNISCSKSIHCSAGCLRRSPAGRSNASASRGRSCASPPHSRWTNR